MLYEEHQKKFEKLYALSLTSYISYSSLGSESKEVITKYR